MSLFRDLFRFSTKEVATAFKTARAYKSCNGIKILAAPQALPLPYGKLLIITTRSLGKAHDRNRIKRQIKAIFFEEKLYQKSMTWIILLYPKALTLSFPELKSVVIGSLQ